VLDYFPRCAGASSYVGSPILTTIVVNDLSNMFDCPYRSILLDLYDCNRSRVKPFTFLTLHNVLAVKTRIVDAENDIPEEQWEGRMNYTKSCV
jgi:hypothetical protein